MGFCEGFCEEFIEMRTLGESVRLIKKNAEWNDWPAREMMLPSVRRPVWRPLGFNVWMTVVGSVANSVAYSEEMRKCI